jgi:hypothetical protein
MTTPIIVVAHKGRLGNRMFQAMLAAEIAHRVPGAVIRGLRLPEWNLVRPAHRVESTALVLRSHRFNLDEACWLLRTGAVTTLVIDAWAQRLNYFGAPARYRRMFEPQTSGHEVGDHELVINVRTGDILDGHHPEYYPLPFSYYARLIDSTGLDPVFIGELEENPYTRALKSRFAGARFHYSQSWREDFETLRNARHLALSISTFSWLAGWLSERAVSIHLPVAGLFDPRKARTLLLPLGDSRYRYHRMNLPDMASRKKFSPTRWANSMQSFSEYPTEQLAQIVSESLVPKQDPGPV